MADQKDFSFKCCVCFKSTLERVCFSVQGALVCLVCAAEISDKYLKYIPAYISMGKRNRG